MMQENIKAHCYLCGSLEHGIRPGRVRDNEDLQICECQCCGLVFLSGADLPDGFYEQAGMHGDEAPPVGQWLRESQKDDERRFGFLGDMIINADLLDFGCGGGGFLLQARSKARSVMGIELEARLQSHFEGNNLAVVQKIDNIPHDKTFDVITAFHVIEHLQDPAAVLAQLSARLRKGGRIVIEVPSAADALLTLYESEPFGEFTYWSCHRYLFNANNLSLLAKKAGLKIDFVKHVQRYPLSNHLYWLAKHKPGGHALWNFLDSEDLSNAYEANLAALGKTDTIIAGLRHLK